MLKCTSNIRRRALTFWRMPIKAKQMFFICFCLCGVAKIAIHWLSYKRLSIYFGHSCKMLSASTLASPKQLQQALAIRRAIALAAHYTPWNSSCLTQALVAKFWCQRYNIPYLFFIGIAKKKHSPTIDAHAWVTTGPLAITGGQSLETHQVICSYSNVL